MWQLELLSLIIPAFGALGQDFIDKGDLKLSRHAHDYSSDVATIGCALAVSGGEWTSGLGEEELNQLLKALQSRLPKRWGDWGLMDIFSSASVQSRLALKPSSPLMFHSQIVESVHKDQDPSRKLLELAEKIKKEGLGGYDACSQVPDQTETERAKYLGIIRQNTDLQLFHKDELKSESRLGRFLTRQLTVPERLLNSSGSPEFYATGTRSFQAEIGLNATAAQGLAGSADLVYALANDKQEAYACSLLETVEFAPDQAFVNDSIVASQRLSRSTSKETQHGPSLKVAVSGAALGIPVEAGPEAEVILGSGRITAHGPALNKTVFAYRVIRIKVKWDGEARYKHRSGGKYADDDDSDSDDEQGKWVLEPLEVESQQQDFPGSVQVEVQPSEV
ncbi:hypothetical protein CSOJ01_11923 [Colletotrichum sojae]|uniref:Uncharacterized protein n=1 Tax=Colletotrichum sojae TaxID=2175907 RepID=A0A8H6MN72_9PEZI|nr:hypothetical protein CSOJ01_11923 [Colletotrichum sojae]